MELDGLVVWYISVEHVRRMKSVWSAGSPLGMTSQGFVSGNKKKKYTMQYNVSERANARTKAIYKTVQLSLVDRKKNSAFTNQLTRQNSKAGLRIRILTDLLRVDLHSIKTAL